MSAGLLYLAYRWPLYCGIGALIFLIPLYLSAGRLRFKEGFLWGALFYSLHLIPIAQILYDRAVGEWRLTVYVLLVVYMATQSGLWFFVAHRLDRYLCLRAVWPIITGAYFVWGQTRMFWFLGEPEGYPFSLPIIPLAAYAPSLRMMPLIGVYGITAILIMMQWLFAQYIRNKEGRYAAGGLVLLSVFCIGFFCKEDTPQLPDYLQQLVYVSLPQCAYEHNGHPIDCAQAIASVVQEGVEQFDKPVCFVLPESAFPFVLHPYVRDLWQSILDDNGSQLIVGIHKKDGFITKNSFIQLDFCRIIQTYEKKHSVIFTEKTPFYLKGCYFLSHLFGGKTDRSLHNNYIRGTYTSLIRIYTYYFFPVLCSELFFNDFSSLPFKKVPILLLCNDKWFTSDHMKNLMFLYAKTYAINWKRPLIYISHSKGALISQTGRAADLTTIA